MREVNTFYLDIFICVGDLREKKKNM